MARAHLRHDIPDKICALLEDHLPSQNCGCRYTNHPRSHHNKQMILVLFVD